jgi:hypothetical protein
MWTRFGFGIAVGAWGLLTCAACRDVSPVRKGASTAEAGTAADDGRDTNSCAACIDGQRGPDACAKEVGACLASEKCATLHRCMSESGCYEKPDQESGYECSIPCAVEAGISSSEDPNVVLAYDVALCGARECSDLCHYTASGATP